MLKLIKYELINSYRSFLFVFLAYLLACVLVPLLPIQPLMIFSTLLSLSVVGIVVAVFINIVVNFNKSMFGSAGYLTMTLPVSTHQIILAKLLANFVYLIVMIAILFGGLTILMLIMGAQANMNLLNAMIQTLNMVMDLIAKNMDIFTVGLISGFMNIIMTLLLIYFSISCTHTKFTRNHRSLISIAVFFGISILMTYCSDFIEFQLFDFITSSAMMPAIWSIGTAFVVSVALYFGTYFVIEKQLEIE